MPPGADGRRTIWSLRALRRFRYVLPALAIPVCAAAVCVGLQAAVFGHAPRDALVATQALRWLVRYRVMRGTEMLAGRRLGSSCVQGWFRMGRHHKLVPGAIVLLSNGVRLYDVGRGVRVLPPGARHSRPADLEDRFRFVLAACPRYLTNRLAPDLVRGKAVETIDGRTDGTSAAAIVVGSPRSRLALDVTRVTFLPIELAYRYGRFSGWTDLVPGGGGAEVWRVRNAFHLPVHSRRVVHA